MKSILSLSATLLLAGFFKKSFASAAPAVAVPASIDNADTKTLNINENVATLGNVLEKLKQIAKEMEEIRPNIQNTSDEVIEKLNDRAIVSLKEFYDIVNKLGSNMGFSTFEEFKSFIESKSDDTDGLVTRIESEIKKLENGLLMNLKEVYKSMNDFLKTGDDAKKKIIETELSKSETSSFLEALKGDYDHEKAVGGDLLNDAVLAATLAAIEALNKSVPTGYTIVDYCFMIVIVFLLCTGVVLAWAIYNQVSKKDGNDEDDEEKLEIQNEKDADE